MDNEKQKKKLLRLAELNDEGPVVFMKQISDLEDEVDAKFEALNAKISTYIQDVSKKASEALVVAQEVSDREGKPGYTPQKGIDYEDGQDYVLTETDKNEIASKVKVPVIDRVIEKYTTEVVKEIPVVKETIKETIKNDMAPQEVRDLLELLSEDERLDAKAIKNLPEVNPPNGPMQHPVALSNLPDVSIAGITTGQSIKWNGNYFESYTPGSGSGDSVFQQDSGTKVITPIVAGDLTLRNNAVNADVFNLYSGFNVLEAGSQLSWFDNDSTMNPLGTQQVTSLNQYGFGNVTTGYNANINTSSIDSSDKTFTLPNESGQVCLIQGGTKIYVTDTDLTSGGPFNIGDVWIDYGA